MTQVFVEGAGGELAEADGLSRIPAKEQLASPVCGVAASLVEF